MISISPQWKEAYPGAAVGFLAMEDVDNPSQHADLDQRKQALESELRLRYAGLDRSQLAALPVLQAYTTYYRLFKKTYHVQLQLESLLFKGRSIPKVAALVEAMFMAELDNQLLTAGHDLERLRLPVQVDIAQGGERYTVMRGEEQELKPGDMYMADEEGIISSVVYGPDQRSQITTETHEVLFAVYAPPGIERKLIERHLYEIEENVSVVAPHSKTILKEVFGAA